MKKAILTLVASIAAFFVVSAQAAKPAPAPVAPAPEPVEEVTMDGTIKCAKCELKETKVCSDVVKVGEKTFYLEEDGKVKTSAHQCKGTAPVTVSGRVEDREGKKFIVVSKIEKK